jgi:ABC-2 type transport system permease protein
MLIDDLRGMFYTMVKDLRAYYFKPPNISWGIIFPFAFVLAFVIRDPANVGDMVPGLVALTLLFGTTSMEAIVITFERRIGALERLLLAPMRLPALLAGKLLGGMVFGLVTSGVVLTLAWIFIGVDRVIWGLLIPAILLTAAAFSALGVLVSVSVREVFEAQTLANGLRFPMMFLGGVFVPVTTLPTPLRIVARTLPLTYAVEVLEAALGGGVTSRAALDLIVLAAFTALCFGVAVGVLRRRLE